MTNPDNVGGLPSLPSPVYEVPSGDGYGARYYTADQMRAYGEKCRDDAVAMIATYERNKAELRRAAPADNVGGLLSCPFCGKPVDFVSNRDWHRIQGEHEQACPLADYEFATPATDEDRMSLQVAWNRRDGELCRAAPAGGDVERDADFYSAGYSNGYKHATKDSAPAGSGEVEELRATAWSNWEFIEHVTNWIIERGLLEITHEGGSLEAAKNITDSLDRALLRKLSQGADYVMVPRVPTEAMEVAFCETWFAKRRPIDDPEMADAYAAMIAASQGQEGGHARD